MKITGDKNQICQTKKISDECAISNSNTCEEVVHTREINSKMEFKNSTSPRKSESCEDVSKLKKKEQQNKPEDNYSETASNKIEFESSEDGTIGFALVDEKSISDDLDVEENVVRDSLSCEEDTHICESDDADYAGKDNFEGNQSNVLEKGYDVDSGSIGTQNFEDDTSKDMSINEASENRDYFSNGNDEEKEEEEEENKVSDINNLLEGENSENNATESEEDSWEYEWEEEEEYEYEYYEEEDDEYKVQKFDGSFSVSLKT